MTGRTDKRQLEEATDGKGGKGRDGSNPNGSRPKAMYPDYLGPWPVARGENAQQYESLLSAVVAYYNPSVPSEWMRVRDAVDCEWQKLRMRRTVTACIDVALVGAIQQVLKSLRTHMALSARSYAEGYVKGSESDRSFVLDILREDGLTEEVFTATAVSMLAEQIGHLDRSAMGHQACRDEAIRNLEQRRASKAANLPKPSADEAEYVIEDNSKDQKDAA